RAGPDARPPHHQEDGHGHVECRRDALHVHGPGGRRALAVTADSGIGARPAGLRPVPPALVEGLSRILEPDRVLSRPLDRLGRSADASIYRLIPDVVVRPRDLAEV